MGYKPRFRPNPDIIVGKKPEGYDPHITRQLELECFGKEWVKEYGTECGCFRCNPPKGPGPGGANLRKKKIDGIMWPVPDGVPDNAHLRVNEGRWGYANHFNEGMWEWTDEKTGDRMACKVIGIGDLTPAFRQSQAFGDALRGLNG